MVQLKFNFNSTKVISAIPATICAAFVNIVNASECQHVNMLHKSTIVLSTPIKKFAGSFVAAANANNVNW